jgi:hypothetical protein
MKKYYNLFLDDCRKPQDVDWIELPLCEWTTAKSYNEFIKIVSLNGIPKRVSFDNDLADEHYESLIKGSFQQMQETDAFIEKTGYDCLKWLTNYCVERQEKFPEYYIHTMNPVGRENMEKYLKNFFKNNAHLQS